MKEKGILREILSTSIFLLIVVFATYLLITFVAQRAVVRGSSMEPTLYGKDASNPEVVGDSLIVDKISYRFRDPQRFDIIVFNFQYNSKEDLIKRIIGLPGETVQIDADGNIYINGERLEEGYGKEVILDPGRAAEPITLGEGEYFVLGDNRNNSTDSRSASVGNVHESMIIGRAWLRIWPLSRFGILKHR